jgi:hypothetical protein
MFSLSCLVSALAPSRGGISGIGAPQSSIMDQSILRYDNHMKMAPTPEDKVRAFVRETINTLLTNAPQN